MPLVIYTLIRVVLFVVVLLALAFAGFQGWLLVLLAALIAFCVSYLFLRPFRNRSAEYLAARARLHAQGKERFSKAIEADAAVEDAAVEAAVDTSAVAEPPVAKRTGRDPQESREDDVFERRQREGTSEPPGHPDR